MNSAYDLICSAVIGGIVLVMLVGFNSTIVEKSGVQTIKLMTQTNLTKGLEIIEYDFRKMGYRVPSAPDSSIIYGDSSQIKFVGDFQNISRIDTIIYRYDASTASGMNNQNTHPLYRTYIVKGSSSSTTTLNLGFTSFRLRYYMSDVSSHQDTLLTSNPISLPSLVRTIRLAVNVESREPYKETSMPYLKLNPGVYWERTIRPCNLFR